MAEGEMGRWGAMILGAAAVMALAGPAAAETINAECTNGGTGNVSLYVDIDTSAQTAKSYGAGVDPASLRANPATIGAASVTWEYDNGLSGRAHIHESWTLDRNTGAAVEVIEQGGRNYQNSFVCRPARKLF